MGRYWTSNSFSGKFTFAVQSSGDPTIFGMKEQEPSCVDYYLDSSKEVLKKCKKVIDAQYDILGIKQKDRLYEVKSLDEIWALHDKYYLEHYRPYNLAEDKEIPYHSDVFKDGAIPKKPEYPLAWGRLSLGCAIYTDLVKDGYCSLNAEL